MNKVSGARGTITKDLIFMSCDSQKERRKKDRGRKLLTEIMAENFSNLAKEIPTYSRS